MPWINAPLNNNSTGMLAPDSNSDPNWRARNTNPLVHGACEYQSDNSTKWHSVPLGTNGAWHEGHCDLQVTVRQTAGTVVVEYFD